MPDEATKTISVVLRHNRVLRVLALANNEIGVVGAQYLAGALEVCCLVCCVLSCVVVCCCVLCFVLCCLVLS